MNKTTKRNCAAVLSAIMIPFSLAACASTINESFDSRSPWLDGASTAVSPSYEKLSYDVSIYDTEKGTSDDARVLIASGSLDFELIEQPSRNYTDLSTAYTVTYNDSAAELDRGLTDTIESEITFQTGGSLFASTMKKTVALADRADTDNLSYTVEADYFGEHIAKKYAPNDPDNAQTLSIPAYNTYHDNEMLFYLARAQALSPGSSSAFYMVNIFDSFLNGKLTNYVMAVSCSSTVYALTMDPWVADFGVEAATADDGTVSYPVNCYYTTIMINATKHGPPYNVYYSANPFVTGDDTNKKEHAKIPMLITYAEYSGVKQVKFTEYRLKSCSFEKSAE